MAQLIQSDQLSPIQGTAGNRQVVQDTTPTVGDAISNTVQRVGNIADAAGSIYANNRAQVFVNEAIESVDSARAAAQQQLESGVEFTDTPPEGVEVDTSEWALIQSAVASGDMTREKARLIASSRLRTRIAEQPLFASKLRQAASSVLGFNIESEPAQQYFASLPTEASLRASGRQTEAQKLEEEVALISSNLNFDPDFVRETILSARFSAQMKDAAKNAAELGGLNAQRYTTEMEAADQRTAFARVSGRMKAFEQAEGKPADGVAMSRIIDEEMQAYIQEFNTGWTDSNGQINTPEHTRAIENIRKRYEGYKQFVTDYGIDNMTSVEIQRIEQMHQLMGQELFPQLTFITKTFGQQVTSDILELTSLNDVQRETILEGRPELRRAYNMLGQDSAAFTKGMVGAYEKILSGADLNETDMQFVDYIAQEGHRTGSLETKGSLVQGLADSGFDWKALSVIAQGSPRNEAPINKEYFTKKYEQDLAPAVGVLAEELSLSPRINWTVDEDGMVVVSQDSAGGALPTPTAGGLIENPIQVQQDIVAFNRAQQAANKINQFAIGLSNGWDNEVGESVIDYSAKVRSMLQQNMDNLRINKLNTAENTLAGYLEAGQTEEAKEQYRSMQEDSPELYQRSFEELIEEANRRSRFSDSMEGR